MVTATRRLTLDEFLALPEDKPYREFVRGEVIEKPMPGPRHSRSVTRLIRQLGAHSSIDLLAEIGTELRHAERGDEERVYLPDVSVTLLHRYPVDQTRGPIEVHPDIAIEVLSPDDRAAVVLDKVEFYLRAGVAIAWIIDPEGGTLTEFRPERAQRLFRPPDRVSAEPVLPGFELDLAALFAEPAGSAPA